MFPMPSSNVISFVSHLGHFMSSSPQARVGRGRLKGRAYLGHPLKLVLARYPSRQVSDVPTIDAHTFRLLPLTPQAAAPLPPASCARRQRRTYSRIAPSN